MRDPGWSPLPPTTPHRRRDSATTTTTQQLAANREPAPSLLSPAADKGKGRAIDLPMPHDDADDERRARRRARQRLPTPSNDVKGRRLTEPGNDRSRSVSRRRYRLPSPPPSQGDQGDCCCCADDAGASAGDDLFQEDQGTSSSASRRLQAATTTTTSKGDAGSSVEWRRASGSSEEGESSLGSSTTSFASSLSPSSSRTRLFDSDDEDYDESPRLFSPITSSSSTSSLHRKESISKAATSDPLLSPSSSSSSSGAPTFSVGKGSSRRGRWVPAPSEATSLECTCAPELPDVVRATVAPSPPASPPRTAASPTSRPSLLTKSLRSLSRLPNLTLPDLIPRLPTADSYLSSARPAPSAPAPELATLPPGWGPAERRRVLAAEPSHAADEARGFVLSLSLRRAARKGFPPAAPVAARAVVDEVEAAAVAPLGMPMRDMGSALAAAAAGEPPHEATLPPATEDVPPLSPAVAPTAASPFSPLPVAVADASGEPAPAAPLQAAAPPVARYISNPRHLLQLAIEFEMMRHAKIRGPLRQRAVIVRQATSPPRYGAGSGRAHERSRLCEEVH
ncbi:hypothetical protein DMC30DRAFT_46762 [Rhodotorula diobovata]|uniref:Uncharacterized protein n=1 Tax=Rhodotorula diobovata TaxID=5288 RepID=A0A5C5FPQ7_9BASI|nr:hypothetical protein DMC30DRAFT_46762 [Rhodotorula diobovata]